MNDRERDVNENPDPEHAGDLAAAASWWVAVRAALGFESGGDDDDRPADRGDRSLPIWPLALTVAGTGAVASLAGTDGGELGSWFAKALKTARDFALENPLVTGSTLAAVFGAYVLGRRAGDFTGTRPLERATAHLRLMGRYVRDRGFSGTFQDIDYGISRVVSPNHWGADGRQRAIRIAFKLWVILAAVVALIFWQVTFPIFLAAAVIAVAVAIIWHFAGLCLWR